MNPIYLDTHIHTSENPNEVNNDYDIELLVEKIHECNAKSDFLISLTDHNMVDRKSVV